MAKQLGEYESSEGLIKFREKRKWQIAFRRYVLEKNISHFYAPYFGLDIENIRKWFECQFKHGLGWDNFASAWQFEYVIPVVYFDFKKEDELKLCWNFLNIRVGIINTEKDKNNRFDIGEAKEYFSSLYKIGQGVTAKRLIKKLDEISDAAAKPDSTGQQSFLLDNKGFIERISNYSAYEFEMLNRGVSTENIEAEKKLLTKYGQ